MPSCWFWHVGRRIAGERILPESDLRARLEAAVGVLNELGSLAELQERARAFVIQGYSCPLSAMSPDHPEVCHMAETLVTDLAGVPIYEHCDRGERPRCCFEVDTTDKAEQN